MRGNILYVPLFLNSLSHAVFLSIEEKNFYERDAKTNVSPVNHSMTLKQNKCLSIELQKII